MTEPAASPRAPQDPPGPGGARHPIAAHPITSAAIAILVAASIICTLVVPIYARITPKIGDWPFFYFYLLAYMPLVAIALWLANVLQRRLRPGNGEAAK
jgi:hypothetical protein